MSSFPDKKIGFFKRSWNTYPEIVGSAFMGAIGIGLMLFAGYYYYSHDLDNRRYKLKYTVYRDDDPRAANVRKD